MDTVVNQWVLFKDAVVTMPGHTYPITCPANSTLSGEVKFDSVVRTQAAIYGQNDFAFESALLRTNLTFNTSWSFHFAVPSAGDYYVRI